MRLTFITLLACLSAAYAQPAKEDIIKVIDSKYDVYASMAHKIWEFAEVGYQEEKSSAILQKELAKEGFKIEAGVAGMPTAFIASYGQGKPVIGVLGEFDALPGISQEAVPELKPIAGKEAGHACGHHLFGTASAAAAIAVKNWMIKNKIAGTLRFYGTPAEEGGSGKVYMVRDGLFKDVDAVLHWHPSAANDASAGSSLANKSGKFRFYGVASHAAGSPERGRSALDGVEAMNNMVNMLREHVPQETRIHYVITSGGEAPNVVPAYAEVYYYVRHPRRDEVKSIWERVEKAAQGAALGTGTRVEVEVTGGVYDLLPNETLARLMDANLRTVGGYTYTEQEKEFGQKIQQSFTGKIPSLEITNQISAFQMRGGLGGSTDVGDVSWVVPTAGLGTATWVPGTAAHSWQAVAAGGMSIGHKGMMVAAKTIALTLTDLFTNPEQIQKAIKELKERTGSDFKYEALLGDRKPALNYRMK
ncbi:amidohydrolase [Fulvivirgaceae bacterium PWU4]|uniref:Amidohydrolase n=1 Tax=Chryseosolibacter histidini TaxID=2782349 RepID=A0AAP2DTW2_9BACT|nr:amidohydrolase [Chryseosolibacter histidini]MBT1700857.1 amidohydrolase [Chryseosolibacter histidini]